MSEKIAVAEKQLVVFTLGKESYAVDIAMVREIIQLQPITRVPGTPYAVEGIISLRGSVIPVVDLRKRFQLDKVEKSKATRIVVVNCRGRNVGVIVDSVAEVLRIPVDSIESSSNLFQDNNLEHFLGIVKLAKRLIILLDMDRVLSGQDIATLNSLEIENIQKSRSQTREAVLT
jgi:purine-binding chemotaxis protein CheW